MSSLSELKNAILEDGVIDAAEVSQIESVIFDDGVIDQEEADFLFELNDAVSGKNNDAGWSKLFIKAISSYLLEDEESPGEIDDDEAQWLHDKIAGDGKIDSVEKLLLMHLRDNAKGFPEKLASLI